MRSTHTKPILKQHGIIFDTLACMKRLMKSGVPEKQAEAEAKEFAMLANDHLDTKQDVADIRKDIDNIKKNMATKLDIAELKSELKQDIAALRTESASHIANLRAELLKIIGGVSIATTSLSTVILGLLMTVFKFIH